MEKKMTYESAIAELYAIAKEIENEVVSVDELAAKVKRTGQLVDFCQAKLKSTEAEVSKITNRMENPEG